MIKHNYLSNMPLDEAVAKYRAALDEAGLSYKTEIIKSAESFGRVTANAVYARSSSPHYNACAMDGIALKAERTFGASELSPAKLQPSDFTVVDTGDPLPEGADCVVMAEDVVETDGGAVLLYTAAVPWQNVRQIGEDICAGDMLMPSFTEITPALAGALLAGGVLEVEVVKQPLAGIIPTGDEIVPPAENPKPGDIAEFNSVIFTGMLREWGAAAKTYPITPDRLELIETAVREAAEECDLILVIAGSSAGREDYTAQAVKNTGTLVLHGIAIKPGKPAVLGLRGTVPVIGVPGYSVSAMIVMDKVTRGVVERLTRKPPREPEAVEAAAARKIPSSLKYREFVRVSLSGAGEKLTAVPLNRGAGVITSFTKAHGMTDIPQNSEGVEAGETVRVELLRHRKDLEKMLVITGSHDPLIDEAADLLKRSGSPFEVASSHVGSMGAVMAVKEGRAHAGGIHLLDTRSGEYNIPYLKQYFPAGGAALMEGVVRVQGIMTAPGNPKGITGFEDIPRVSYVNRQRGSGTRILCDFLAAKHGVDTREVYGYDREEFTHTAVAALIASGSADAGLGIYAAAKIYGLEFIPVAREEYDFLCRAEELENEKLRALAVVLQSPEFLARLEKLGGYIINKPGAIKTIL